MKITAALIALAVVASASPKSDLRAYTASNKNYLLTLSSKAIVGVEPSAVHVIKDDAGHEQFRVSLSYAFRCPTSSTGQETITFDHRIRKAKLRVPHAPAVLPVAFFVPKAVICISLCATAARGGETQCQFFPVDQLDPSTTAYIATRINNRPMQLIPANQAPAECGDLQVCTPIDRVAYASQYFLIYLPVDIDAYFQ